MRRTVREMHYTGDNFEMPQGFSIMPGLETFDSRAGFWTPLTSARLVPDEDKKERLSADQKTFVEKSQKVTIEKWMACEPDVAAKLVVPQTLPFGAHFLNTVHQLCGSTLIGAQSYDKLQKFVLALRGTMDAPAQRQFDDTFAQVFGPPQRQISKWQSALLPMDAMGRVIAFLNASDVLTSLECVCQRWRSASMKGWTDYYETVMPDYLTDWQTRSPPGREQRTKGTALIRAWSMTQMRFRLLAPRLAGKVRRLAVNATSPQTIQTLLEPQHYVSNVSEFHYCFMQASDQELRDVTACIKRMRGCHTLHMNANEVILDLDGVHIWMDHRVMELMAAVRASSVKTFCALDMQRLGLTVNECVCANDKEPLMSLENVMLLVGQGNYYQFHSYGVYSSTHIAPRDIQRHADIEAKAGHRIASPTLHKLRVALAPGQTNLLLQLLERVCPELQELDVESISTHMSSGAKDLPSVSQEVTMEGMRFPKLQHLRISSGHAPECDYLNVTHFKLPVDNDLRSFHMDVPIHMAARITGTESARMDEYKFMHYMPCSQCLMPKDERNKIISNRFARDNLCSERIAPHLADARLCFHFANHQASKPRERARFGRSATQDDYKITDCDWAFVEAQLMHWSHLSRVKSLTLTFDHATIKQIPGRLVTTLAQFQCWKQLDALTVLAESHIQLADMSPLLAKLDAVRTLETRMPLSPISMSDEVKAVSRLANLRTWTWHTPKTLAECVNDVVNFLDISQTYKPKGLQTLRLILEMPVLPSTTLDREEIRQTVYSQRKSRWLALSETDTVRLQSAGMAANVVLEVDIVSSTRPAPPLSSQRDYVTAVTDLGFNATYWNPDYDGTDYFALS